MPRSTRSLRATDLYRSRLKFIREQAETSALRGFGSGDWDAWSERAATVVASAQTQAVRAASGYLTAFLSAELGRRVPVVRIDSRVYAGTSRDGRPVAESLRSPVIGMRAALKDGKSFEEALSVGVNRAKRIIEMDVMHAGRKPVLDTIEADDRFDGWKRATAGTCGACMALSGTSGDDFGVHPGCQCQPSPVVRGVRDLVPLLSGMEMFQRMTKDEQDAQFGPEKAEALRLGEITLAALVAHSTLDSDQPNFLTEAPLNAAAT